MAKDKFFKVTTNTKTFKVKAVESSRGFFGGRITWRLYSSANSGLFTTYSQIGDCDDLARIGEAIRVAYANVKKIEVVNQ
ncbi:MAG: hypothetical protein KA536_15730 [Saprospiraceae bacterium]|nr:hypothetical protein [Saprospiraceae bacterium]